MQPTPYAQLGKALEGLPGYILGYTVGLLAAILTDVLMTTLLIGCVALGFITTPLIAIAAFFLIYATLASVTNLAMSLSQTGGRIAQSIAQQQPSYMIQPPPSDPPSDAS